MRKLILPLLCAAYLGLSLIVAVLMVRNGGGSGAALAAMIGVLALCFAFHGLIARALENAAATSDLAAIREAHRILLEQVERLDARVTEALDSVAHEAVQRSEELTTEVHLLEDLVARMSTRLEERMAAGPAPETRAPNLSHRQSSAMLETVREALAENRVDLYLQPVVSLPQRRTVFYESYSRLRDASGRVIMPAEYLAVAEPEGLVTSIDNLLLFRCVQIVRRLAKQDRKIGIFCNISPASLADETFFPQFLEMLSANRDLSGSLIFELGQGAFDARGSIESRNMAKLADLGFRFSIDKVMDLDLDLQDLARADVKFLKIGAQLMLDEVVDTEEGLVLRSLPDLQAEDFANLTRRYGVEIIAEKVETERQVVDILELDIAYGQGNLFQEPRPIRDAVLAEAGAGQASPAADEHPTSTSPSPTAQRRVMGAADWRRI